MFDAWLVSAHLAQYLALMAGFGLPLFALHALLREHAALPVIRQMLRLTGLVLTLALIASAVGMWVMARSMSDGDAASTWATAHTLLTQTAVGIAWIIRVALLIIAIAIAAFSVSPMPVRVAAMSLLAAGAVATLAWTGHGAMSEGMLAWAHLGVDIAHLIAAGAWLGALLALVLIAKRTAGATDDEAMRLLATTSSGFARLGSIIVVTLVVSGIANYLFILGPSFTGVFTTLYGRLLLAKLGLFLGMLALAGANRFRFAPALTSALRDGNTADAVFALRRSLWAETTLAFGVLVFVSILGTLNPTE